MSSEPRVFNLPVSLLLLIQMLGGMVVAPCLAFLPVYLKDLGLSVLFISAVVTLQRISGLLASVVGGALSDAAGRKPTILLGQIGFFAGILVFLTGSPPLVAVLWSLCGFGLGLLTLGSQSYLMDHANARFLGVLTALYYWGHTLGSTLSNAATGMVLDRIGYRGVGLALAALGAVTVLLSAVLLPGGTGERRGPHAGRQRQRTGMISGYRAVAVQPGVAMLAVLRFLPTFCYGMMTVFIPLLLRDAGAARSTIAYYAAVSSVGASLAQLAAGRLADRLGPRGPATAAYLALAGSAAGIAATSGSLGAVFVLGTLGISAAWSLSTLMMPMVALAAGGSERGRTLGFMHLFWNLAMILGALLGGVLFEGWKGLPFAVGAAVVAAAIPLLYRFIRKMEARSFGDSGRTSPPPSRA